jgi:hypothetical protein
MTARRGPGRPPLNPDGGEAQALTVRLSPAQVAKVESIRERAGLKSLADAVRWAVENAPLPKKGRLS